MVLRFPPAEGYGRRSRRQGWGNAYNPDDMREIFWSLLFPNSECHALHPHILHTCRIVPRFWGFPVCYPWHRRTIAYVLLGLCTFHYGRRRKGSCKGPTKTLGATTAVLELQVFMGPSFHASVLKYGPRQEVLTMLQRDECSALIGSSIELKQKSCKYVF